jgi:NodT family efflux transporter outer membrane factor (OMF) lipoprotein
MGSPAWQAAVIGLAALLALSACALKKPPETDAVLTDALPETTEVPAGWTAPAGDTRAVDDGWLESFQDAELEALVREALDRQNPNMRLAATQVDRAAALARVARAGLMPTIGMGAEISDTTGPNALSGSSGGAGVGFSWELDVWGRVRAGARAADENLRATKADFEFARQSIAAQTARSWFLITELQLQLDLAEETVRLLADLTRLVQDKYEVGQVTLQDVSLVRADLFSAEDALRQGRGARIQAARSLEVLLGRYPAAEVEGREDLPPPPPPVPAGVPSDILERRPDLQAAERRVRSAFYASEEARLARLPSFNLTGAIGGGSAFDETIGNLGLGMVAPLFTGGALEGQLDAATADQEAAVASYGLTVLRAFEEVETALTNESLLEEREGYLARAAEDYRKAYDLARIQYDVGRVDLLTVLDFQLRWLGARMNLIHVRNLRLAARVDLHLALGGSFERRDVNEFGSLMIQGGER